MEWFAILHQVTQAHTCRVQCERVCGQGCTPIRGASLMRDFSDIFKSRQVPSEVMPDASMRLAVQGWAWLSLRKLLTTSLPGSAVSSVREARCYPDAAIPPCTARCIKTLRAAFFPFNPGLWDCSQKVLVVLAWPGDLPCQVLAPDATKIMLLKS